MSAAMVAAAVWGAGGAARAQPVRFGFVAAHALPEDIAAELEPDERREHVEAAADRAARLGASLVRLGVAAPRIASYEAVVGPDHAEWTELDLAVESFTTRGVSLCLTLAEVASGGDVGAWAAFVRALAERYDGDAEFLVAGADLNAEFPDVNGSGAVTDDDWTADEPALLAWAAAHRVDWLEVGYAPWGDAAAADTYAAGLQAAALAVAASGGSVRVALAATRMDDGVSKSDLVDALAPLPVEGGPWFEAASADVLAATGALGQAWAASLVAKLGDWLGAVGHDSAERWAGVAVGGVPGVGPCADPRCSERTQAAALVELVARALGAGVTLVAWDHPVEWAEPWAGPIERRGTGLVVASPEGGVLAPRPAYAVWRALQGWLEGVEPADVVFVEGLPAHAAGFRFGERGWLLWYGWHAAAGASTYGGAIAELPLEGVDAAALRVVRLWPESLAPGVAADGDAGATWSEELLPVLDGRGWISVGQDAVWVERADLVADTGGDGAQVVPPDDLRGPQGCGATPGGDPAPGQQRLLFVLLIGLGVAGRRYRFSLRASRDS